MIVVFPSIDVRISYIKYQLIGALKVFKLSTYLYKYVLNKILTC